MSIVLIKNTPIEKALFEKTTSRKKYDIKGNPRKSNDHCNDWKYILVSSGMGRPKAVKCERKPFCMSSQRYFFIDDTNECHWVGYQIMKPIYAENP